MTTNSLLRAVAVVAACFTSPLGAQARPEASSPAPPTVAAPARQATPQIYFRAPRDGAVVGPTFDLAFGLKNYGVAPAGVNLPNTGHFHVIINATPPAPGMIVPADSLHRHFGGGQIETSLTLAPGRYTLRLVLADFEHKVIGPPLISAPIHITVRER
ncbi:MAG: DUF4399 domain-containing protein [Gemmatimonadetes bacterium]|nr:DUF4399 domain-containing protein [Gemmatimonadota bacterium]